MPQTSSHNYDTIIVGGGLVGAAVACGIAARGARVAVLDGGDRDFRASRGNFGLVWVQGKGADFAAYARLSARPPLKPITLGQLASSDGD